MAQRTRRELRKSRGSEAQLLDEELDKVYVITSALSTAASPFAKGGTIHGSTPIRIAAGVATLSTTATPIATGFTGGCFGAICTLVSPVSPTAYPDISCTPLTNGNIQVGSSPTTVIGSWIAVGY